MFRITSNAAIDVDNTCQLATLAPMVKEASARFKISMRVHLTKVDSRPLFRIHVHFRSRYKF